MSMDMGDMADRCMNASGSMMGGGMMGNSILLIILLVLLFVWVVGLAAVGALIFWVARRFAETRSSGSQRSSGAGM
jgi:flagellar basal body-associated protein FliL